MLYNVAKGEAYCLLAWILAFLDAVLPKNIRPVCLLQAHFYFQGLVIQDLNPDCR